MKKKKNKKRIKKRRKALRTGSRKVRETLLQQNPVCDICGCNHSLELHHVYLIRHGYMTELKHCVLLCANCHRLVHAEYDDYMDYLFLTDPNTDFMAVYEQIKSELQLLNTSY